MPDDANIHRNVPGDIPSDDQTAGLTGVPQSASQLARRADGPGDLKKALAEDGVDLIAGFLHRFDNARTRRSYGGDLADFFGAPSADLFAAQSVTFFHVNEYIARLQADGKSPATLRRRIASIRGFYDWLDAIGLISENPTKRQLLRKLGRAHASDKPIVVLTASQASDLISAASEHPTAGVRDSTLLRVLLHCVLRRSEAAAMDAEHVRPIGRFWVLDLPITKGGSDQYVKVPDHVVEAIDVHRDYYDIDSGPLWRSMSPSSKGNRLTPFSIYRIVRNCAKRAGLPDIGAHTLRHTGCTLALESGASIPQVQAHARHKKVETTMAYLHQRDRLRDSAADYIKLDEKKRR